MHRPSYESIVDHMVSALAEKRRYRFERHAAYVALAHAILADEQSPARELEDASQLDGFVTVATAAA